MKQAPRVIRRPQAQPLAQRTAWGIVTTLFWGAYLALLAPLALVRHMAGMDGVLAVIPERPFDQSVLLSIGGLALIAAALLVAWAEVHGRITARRPQGPQTPVGHIRVAYALGASRAVAGAAQHAKVVVLQMDDNARPRGTTCRVPPAATSATAPQLHPMRSSPARASWGSGTV